MAVLCNLIRGVAGVINQDLLSNQEQPTRRLESLDVDAKLRVDAPIDPGSDAGRRATLEALTDLL